MNYKQQQNTVDDRKNLIGTKEFARSGGLARLGTKNRKTVAKEEAWKAYEQKMVDSLFAITRAQLMIALGSQYLFRIKKEKVGKTIVSKKAERVTDPDEIEMYLDDYINGDVDTSPEADYFFFTANDPDIRAISDILDRINGKPTQRIAGDRDNPLSIVFDNSFNK